MSIPQNDVARNALRVIPTDGPTSRQGMQTRDEYRPDGRGPACGQPEGEQDIADLRT